MRGFADRRDAGRQLGARLALDRTLRDVVVVGLPRGGVPVADEVAAALGAPLEVMVVRKVGLPYQPEVAMGAIGENGVVVVEDDVLKAARITTSDFATAAARERVELERRVRRYREGREPMDLHARTVVVVDDGIATGATIRAACRVVRDAGASRVVLAVPVASSEALRRLRGDADEVTSLISVEGSFAVGQWYEEFDQTSDEEVVSCLGLARARQSPGGAAGSGGFDADIAGGVKWR